MKKILLLTTVTALFTPNISPKRQPPIIFMVKERRQ